MSEYEDSEANSNPVRAVLVPSAVQNSGAPLQLEVAISDKVQPPSCLPLCVVSNPRSAWNKIGNIRTFLRQVGPDILILSEHWGRKSSFENALAVENFKVIESSRAIRGIPTKGRKGKPSVSVTGGGVALVYNEENFIVEDAGLNVPNGIEAVWAILTPKSIDIPSIKKILVGGIYIAPQSQFKQLTIEHIIETMYSVQSRYDSQIRFLISGDFNKVSIENILEANGAMHQICSVPTHGKQTLELVLTCMATLFHPPTTLEPFKQDEDTSGKPSDHKVIIVAPKSNTVYNVERHKKLIHIRPQPKSKVAAFMREMGTNEWSEVFNSESPDEQAEQFHLKLTSIYEKHFPVKSVRMSSLDKKWFNPTLKIQYNEMQHEFFKNRKSEKWKHLRICFRKAKRKASNL